MIFAALRKLMPPALVACLALALLAAGPLPAAGKAAPRLALILGNGNYASGQLATAANDAGLIAGVLLEAGFDVLGAVDVDLMASQQSAHEFINKITASGPETVAFVYINGYGAQLLGENYLLPAGDATAATPPAQALLLSQLMRGLAASPARARIVVLDLARPRPGQEGAAPAGLALPQTPPGMLLAMNAAPGTLAPPEAGAYSSYALALTAALREPGLPIDEVFARARLHTSALTGGAQTPWHSSSLAVTFAAVAGAGAAKPAGGAPDAQGVTRSRAVSALPEPEAYIAALDRDTIKGYSEFVSTFQQSPLARRMAALLAARREALNWQHAVRDDRAEAYWTYLVLYPRAAHIGEARARLAALLAPAAPPVDFKALDFGILPALEAERPYAERGVALDLPDHFAPPPPLPAWLAVEAPWSPAQPPEPAGPFALATPGLPPNAGAAAAGKGSLALPAAVIIAAASKRLAPRAPAAAAPKPPTHVIITAPEEPPPQLRPASVPVMPAEPAPEPAQPKKDPVAITPVDAPAEPAPARGAPVAITPVEPAPAPAPPEPAVAPQTAPVVISPVEPAPAAPAASKTAPDSPPEPPVVIPTTPEAPPASPAAAPKPARPAPAKPRPHVAPARAAPVKPTAPEKPAPPRAPRAAPADPNAPLDLRPPAGRPRAACGGPGQRVCP